MGFLTLLFGLIYAVLMCLTWGKITPKLHRLFSLIILFGIVIADTFFISVMQHNPPPSGLAAISLLGLIFFTIVGGIGVVSHVSEAAKLEKAKPQIKERVVYTLPETKACVSCSRGIPVDSAFCNYCGISQTNASSAGRKTVRF